VSSTLLGTAREYSSPVDADHNQLCTFKGESEIFLRVWDLIKKMSEVRVELPAKPGMSLPPQTVQTVFLLTFRLWKWIFFGLRNSAQQSNPWKRQQYPAENIQ
jgi:hypothetical protein